MLYNNESLKPKEGYDEVAHVYEAGRPDYPAEMLHALLSVVEFSPGAIICDLGAGTGKLSKAILSAYPNTHIIAVEPSHEMCSQLAQQLPTVSIIRASADAIPLPDSSMDIVVVGTAFHWFATEQALAEIARILKPGGKLGLIWNIFDTKISWVSEIRNIINTYKEVNELGCNHDSLQWKAIFNQQELFTPFEHVTFCYTYAGTQQDVMARIFSSKVVGTLSPYDKKQLITKSQAVLKSYGLLEMTIMLPYRIELYWTSKK